MKSKTLWLGFIGASLILTIAKIFFSLNSTGLEKSTIFFACSVVIFIAYAAFIFFKGENLESAKLYKPNKNPYLGLTSLLLSASFLWNSFSLVTSSPSSDSFFQNFFFLVMSFVSVFSCAALSFSYFSGKNKFERAPILIFFPVFWFIVKMVSYLSISDDTPDQYDVVSTSFILLFFMSQIKLFVNIPNSKNTIKKLFIFGAPAAVSSFMFCVPEIINQVQYSETLTPSTFSSVVIQFVSGVYICFSLINIKSQMVLNKQEAA